METSLDLKSLDTEGLEFMADYCIQRDDSRAFLIYLERKLQIVEEEYD